MKTFIISMAAVIIGVAGLIYRSDLSTLLMIEENLQALTEECAAYAALATEQSDENIVIIPSDAHANAVQLKDYAQSYMPCFSKGRLYIAENGFEVYNSGRSVRVRLIYYLPGGFFRLAFAPQIYQITRESSYQWEDSLEL